METLEEIIAGRLASQNDKETRTVTLSDSNCLTICDTDSGKTDVIGWPWVQELFELSGFRKNSALLTSQPYYDEYGDSAYAVKVAWLDTLDPKIILKIVDGIEGEGPSFSKAILQDNIYII